MGWDRHKLLWDGMGQINMSHGQPCGYGLVLDVLGLRKDVQIHT